MPRKKKDPTTQQAQQVTEPAPGGPDPERAGRAGKLETLEDFERLPEDEQSIIWEKLLPAITDAIINSAKWQETAAFIKTIAGTVKAPEAKESLSGIAEAFRTAADALAGAGKTAESDLASACRGIFSAIDSSHSFGKVVQGAMERAVQIRSLEAQIDAFISDPEMSKAMRAWQRLKPYYEQVIAEQPLPDDKAERRKRMHEAMAEAKRRAMDAGEFEDDKQIQSLGKIERYYLATSKIANQLHDITPQQISGKAIIDTEFTDKKTKETVTTSYSLTMDDDKLRNLSGKPYTRFDRAVLRAICSVWEQAQLTHTSPVFTERSIFQLMKGNMSDDNPSKQFLEKIKESHQKLKSMEFEIDATDELKMRGIEVLDEYGEPMDFGRARAMIYYERLKFKSKKGKSYFGYVLRDIPLVQEYSKLIGQYSSVDAGMLAIADTSGSPIATNESRIAILDYLLQRFAMMRHDENEALERMAADERKRKKNPDLPRKPLEEYRGVRTILFDTIFKECDIDSKNRVILSRHRKYVMDVVEYWRLKGYIQGYSITYKGRAMSGVELVI